MRFEWEWVNDNLFSQTNRAKVIGGWIVHHVEWNDTDEARFKSLTGSMVFIPDPGHAWEMEED